ncbi:MAG: hypothetical protein ABI859_07580 [Pseudomonadota bacterium]
MLSSKVAGTQRGAALVEFQIVTLLAMLPMTLGMLQSAFLLVASQTLHYATFSAARAGAMANANPAVMRRALATGLVPLFAVTADGIRPDNVASVVTGAFARSFAATQLYATLTVLSPSAESFADFGVTEEGVRLIRNDDLAHRSAQPGRRSGLTIQQANLLRLRVTYCHELIVPFADRMLLATLRRLDLDPARQFCYLRGRVPLVAESSVNMQSDAHY